MIRRAALLALQGVTLGARVAVAARALLARKRPPPPEEGPLRVLLMPFNTAAEAGTKYRSRLWAQRLRREGHTVDVSLAIRSERGARLQGRWEVAARVEHHLRVLANRTRAAFTAGRYDVVVIHMSDLPYWEYGVPFIAYAMTRMAGRVLLDLDDLPMTRGEPRVAARARLLADAVDGLILGTAELLPHFPGRPVWHVPTCIEPSERPRREPPTDGTPPVLGWVGTSGNLRPLEDLAPVLARVCERFGARVRVVCDLAPDLPGVPVEHVVWSAEREVEDLGAMDVGLAPLADGPMERCKCGLKVLQYMAAGLPVAASPVGVIAEMVEPGRTGFLPMDPASWETALSALLDDPVVRLRMGAEARRRADARWSFEVHGPRYAAALRGQAPNGR